MGESGNNKEKGIPRTTSYDNLCELANDIENEEKPLKLEDIDIIMINTTTTIQTTPPLLPPRPKKTRLVEIQENPPPLPPREEKK